MEAIRSSETSVQSTTATRRHTPEDGILHSHRRENLKSYKKHSDVQNFFRKFYGSRRNEQMSLNAPHSTRDAHIS
jgi:hypothetical protein